jgi:hypothetical protein
MPGDKHKDKRTQERRRFEEDLETREEAAHPDDKDNLPPGATHELKDDGTVERRRFSAS